jgi:hypothetical protein
MSIELAALLIGDPPETWSTLGFTVADDATHVSGVRHVLGGAERGVRAWSLRGASSDIDRMPSGVPVHEAAPTPEHPNGVAALDHVVVSTPDLGRTIEAFENAGIELRRTRNAGRAASGTPMQQAFFKLGDVVLEVVGPTAPQGDGPPRFYGLAWTVRDLDATSAFLGERLRPAKDAVQEGRRIATLDRNLGGSSVSMAFMSTRPNSSA